MTNSNTDQHFETWWKREGCLTPWLKGEEIWDFAHRITSTAWSNATYYAKMYCNGVSVDKLKLCYVKDNWAYFTTRAVEDQWGDYWNDTPYEHNAGEPYRFCEHDKKDGVIPWEIVKVAWEGDFDTPCDNHWNSPWSVELINRGEIYWLRISDCRTPIQGVAMGVFAGASLQEFRDFVHDNGGVVYEALGAK